MANDTVVGRRCCVERLLLGQAGCDSLQFTEKAVGSACWNVRFKLFRTVTFDKIRHWFPHKAGRQHSNC